MQWNSPRFSEIHQWIVITEPFPLQFKRESTTESGELNAITEEEELRRRRKEIQRIWTGEEEEEEEITGLFSDPNQESTKQNQNPKFTKILVRTSD